MPGSKQATCKRSSSTSSPKKRLAQHLPLINCLLNADPAFWTYIFNHLTNDQLIFLQDIARNFLSGNIPVSRGEVRYIASKKKSIRSLVRASSHPRRRVLVKQIGGGIFGILIPALASLFGALLSGKR